MLSAFALAFLLLTGNWEKNIILLVCLAEALLAEAEVEKTPRLCM